MKSEQSLKKILDMHPENIGSSVMRNALAQHRKQQEEAEAKRALEILSGAQSEIGMVVDQLRTVRKKEKALSQCVLALNKATNDFLNHGDVEKFNLERQRALAMRIV